MMTRCFPEIRGKCSGKLKGLGSSVLPKAPRMAGRDSSILSCKTLVVLLFLTNIMHIVINKKLVEK